jgi:hypothetical protein
MYGLAMVVNLRDNRGRGPWLEAEGQGGNRSQIEPFWGGWGGVVKSTFILNSFWRALSRSSGRASIRSTSPGKTDYMYKSIFYQPQVTVLH